MLPPSRVIFSRTVFSFAYPQIDWAGDAAGYVGTEFPLLPFAVALFYKIAGVHEWFGRLETVLFFAASLPFFYLLVRRIFNETVAVWALVFYSFAPLCIAASRAFMPDFPSLTLSLAGLYFFLRWCDDGGEADWLIAASRSASPFSSREQARSSVCLCFTWAGNASESHSLGKYAFGFSEPLRLSRRGIWYWHAHQIAAQYYPNHFFGAGGFAFMHLAWYAGIFRRVFTETLTPLVSLLALAGVFIAPRGKYARLFHCWLLAMIFFIFCVGYGNRHPWYQLPLVPIAAVFAGIACVEILPRINPQFVRQIFAVVIVLVFATLTAGYTPVYYSSCFRGFVRSRRPHQRNDTGGCANRRGRWR